MYSKYFDFIENPFSIAPDPQYLYMSEMHQDGLAHLKYSLSSEGCIILLTGEVGTGKTTLCRYFLEQLEPTANIALIINPGLNAFELLATVCDEFRVKITDDFYTTKHYIDALHQFLLQSHAANNPALLIIDEAQNLDKKALELVRLLTNLETNQQKLLKIILLGQSELSTVLSGPDLTQVNQRITGRFHPKGLKAPDTAAYITHRIGIAGGRKIEIFSNKAVKRVHQITGGIPRLINSLCDRALLGAYSEDEDVVDESIVKKAAREIFGFDRASKTIQIPVNSLVTVTVAMFLILLIWAGTTSDLFHLNLKSVLPPPAKETQTDQTGTSKQTEPIESVKSDTDIPREEQLLPKPAEIETTIDQVSSSQPVEDDSEYEQVAVQNDTDISDDRSSAVENLEQSSIFTTPAELPPEPEEKPRTRIVIQHIEIAD